MKHFHEFLFYFKQDIDIKKQNPGITTYAFLQFVDINGAMRAKHRMDREFIGRNRIKVSTSFVHNEVFLLTESLMVRSLWLTTVKQ